VRASLCGHVEGRRVVRFGIGEPAGETVGDAS
jgi:hypothetical protein